MKDPVAKGLYIQSALDLAEKHAGSEVARDIAERAEVPEKLSALRDYPLRTLCLCVKYAGARCFAGQSQDEIAAAFGQAAYASFASTLIGRVGLSLTRGSTPEKAARGIARMQNATSHTVVCAVREISEEGFSLHYKGTAHPYYQYGVLLEGFKPSALPVQITTKVLRNDIDDDWVPGPECEFEFAFQYDRT